MNRPLKFRVLFSLQLVTGRPGHDFHMVILIQKAQADASKHSHMFFLHVSVLYL